MSQRGEKEVRSMANPRAKDRAETVPKEAKIDVWGEVAWVGEAGGEVKNGKKRNKLDKRAGLSAARY